MVLQERGDLKVLTFPQLESLGVALHAFTTRHGGVSEGPYSTLNLGYHVGDDPLAVKENRRRAVASLFSPSSDVACDFAGERCSLVAGEQVHGDRIAVVTEADRGKEWAPWAPGIPYTDGLVTRSGGVILSAYFADCVPIYLVDPVEKAIGLVHAGWRGTALGIARKAILTLMNFFGTDPRNLHAGIGPSIGPCCYEASTEVAFRVIRACPEPDRGREGAGEVAMRLGGEGSEGEKWSVNLWEANRRQILSLGVPPLHVSVSGMCTCCRQDLFFSYRGSGAMTGRMAAFLALRSYRG